MTVNELIGKLINLPPNAQVVVYGGLDGEDLVEATEVDNDPALGEVKIW